MARPGHGKARRIGIDARCFQDDSALRGTGRYVRGLLGGLASRDDDAEVDLLLDDGEGWDDPEPRDLGVDGRLYGHPTRRLALEVGRHGWRRRSRALSRSLRACGLDLLHVPAQYLLYRHQRFSLPYVVTVHDLIPFVGLEDDGTRQRRRLLRKITRLAAICRRARGVIVISAHTRDDCVRMLGLRPGRIRVIPLGVEPHFRAEPGPDDAGILARHAVRGPYVLYVGAQDPHKNLESLLGAVRRLREDGRDLRLVVVGRKGEELPGAGEPWVHYTGWVADDELPALYRGAALFATLSAYEGFCLPALEAMACGTPVVASRAAALPETVGDAGLSVDPFDVRAAAEAMRGVLGQPALAQELGRRGVARARGFGWDEVARAHAEVYRRAARGQRP